MFPFAPSYVKKREEPPATESASSVKRSRKKRDRDLSKDKAAAPVQEQEATQRKEAAACSSAASSPGVSSAESSSSNILSYYEDGSMSSIPSTVSNLSCILVYTHACIRYVSGTCKMTLLRGHASINGYSLPLNEGIESINFPCWTPCARLYAGASKKKAKKDSSSSSVLSTLKKMGKLDNFGTLKKKNPTEMNIIDASTCIIFVEGIALEEQEWMVAAEEQRFANAKSPSSADVSEVQLPREGEYVSVQSAAIGDTSAMRNVGIDSTYLPPSWITATDALLSYSPSVDEPSSPISPKALLCGAKGVGKSTCLRYTLNRLLSEGNHRAVCVLDCDVGQSEYTTPGQVSLHVITSPTLVPPHLNLRQPHLGYFYGDITPKHDPSRIVSMITALYAQYENLREQFMKGDYSAIDGYDAKEKKKKGKNDNIFDALNEEYDNINLSTLPLLVNTDGFVRYMGAEILQSVINTVNPTHIFHIVNQKDKFLSALDRYLDPVTQNSHLRPVYALEPGRNAPNPGERNISAADMRILRIVSYFLRKHIDMRTHVGNNNNIEESREVSVYIRNGTLVDKFGMIARALLKSSSFPTPLRNLSFQCLASDVSPNLLLAAVNASLVGLVKSHSSTRVKLEYGACEEDASNENLNLSVEIFAEQTAGSSGVDAWRSPCYGVGIVRGIDLEKEEIILLAPSTLSQKLSEYSKDEKLRLVRGPISVPTQLVHIPQESGGGETGETHHTIPYTTFESAGDGSEKAKARNNVRRRSYTNTNHN